MADNGLITTPIIESDPTANTSDHLNAYCSTTVCFKPSVDPPKEKPLSDDPKLNPLPEDPEEEAKKRWEPEWNVLHLPFQMINLTPHYGSTEQNGVVYTIGDVHNRLVVTHLVERKIKEYRCVGLHSREGCGAKLLIYKGLLICLSPTRAFVTEIPKTWEDEEEAGGEGPAAEGPASTPPPPSTAEPASAPDARERGFGSAIRGRELRTARALLNPNLAAAGRRLENLFREMQTFDESQIEKRVPVSYETEAKGDEMDIFWLEIPVTERAMNSVDVQAGKMWGGDTLACFGGCDTTSVWSIDLSPLPELYANKKAGKRVRYGSDAPSLRWKMLRARNQSPQSRSEHCTHILGDDLFIFSGKNAGIIRMDMWVFNLKHGFWRKLTPEGQAIPTLLFTTCTCTQPSSAGDEGEMAFCMTAYGRMLKGRRPFALSLEVKYTPKAVGDEDREAAESTPPPPAPATASPTLPADPSCPPMPGCVPATPPMLPSAPTGPPPPPPLPPIRGLSTDVSNSKAKLEDMQTYTVTCSPEPGCPTRSSNTLCTPSSAYSCQGMTFLLSTVPVYQDWGLGLFCTPRALGEWTVAKHHLFTEYYKSVVAAWICAMAETEDWLPMDIIQHTLKWWANDGHMEKEFNRRGLPEVEAMMIERKRKVDLARTTDWSRH